jgi:subfamily B ATP-binding cassette protein MsbA
MMYTHNNLLSNGILNLFKDSITLLGLLFVMFFQNWKLALISIVMIPLASFFAKSLGKRIGKVTTEAQEKSGFLTSYLVELFKNHKLIKIFQKEKYEKHRADEHLAHLKDKNKKIQTVFVRMSQLWKP